jgi:uncharacterized protein (TIGR00725 family)
MKATFFGGSYFNQNSKLYEESIEIGKILAKYNYEVHNGGYSGLMEAVSIGAEQANGKSIGHLCTSFGSNKGNIFLTDVIPHDSIYTRLNSLIEGTDLFIVQKGNVGTLSELFLTLDIVRKMKLINRPKIIVFGEWFDNFKQIFSELGLYDNGLIVQIYSTHDLNIYLNKLNSNNTVYEHMYSFDSLDGHISKALKDIFGKETKLINSKYILPLGEHDDIWYFAFRNDEENVYLIKINNPLLGEQSVSFTMKQPKVFNAELFDTKPEVYFNRCTPIFTVEIPNTPFLNSFK